MYRVYSHAQEGQCGRDTLSEKNLSYLGSVNYHNLHNNRHLFSLCLYLHQYIHCKNHFL